MEKRGGVNSAIALISQITDWLPTYHFNSLGRCRNKNNPLLYGIYLESSF